MTAFLFTPQTLATCPLLGGQAVYKARVILSSMEHTVYDDKALCDAVNIVWLRTERAKPNTFVITPNPATNIATVWFEKDMPEAKLSLIDSKGVLLYTQQIAQGTRSINLALEELSPGIYTARLEQADGVVKISKIVVIKE